MGPAAVSGPCGFLVKDGLCDDGSPPVEYGAGEGEICEHGVQFSLLVAGRLWRTFFSRLFDLGGNGLRDLIATIPKEEARRALAYLDELGRLVVTDVDV